MISFSNVTKKFGQTTALNGINLKIKPGEFIFLVGPSGSGKTTVFRLLLRQYLPTFGTIKIEDLDITKIPSVELPAYRQKIGMVFQDLKLLDNRTIFENVALPLVILHQDEPEITEKVEKILEQVGLTNRRDFFPSQLSQGELQRACIARALINKPDIILADEPTGNLDLATGKQIVDLLKEANKKGKTVIMATHDLEFIQNINGKIIEIKDGKIIKENEPAS